MTLPLREEPRRRVDDREVPGRAEFGDESGLQLGVRPPVRVAGQLSDRPNPRRAVVVWDPRVRGTVMDMEAERASGVVPELLPP